MGVASAKVYIPTKVKGIVHNEEKQKVNTNAIVLKFGDIEKENFLATGDPYLCANCSAYMNYFSPYNKATKTWICEFCHHNNIIDIEKEEIPNHSIVTYVDSNGLQKKPSIPKEESKNGTMIFCIDVSGSMNVTMENTTGYKKFGKYISRIDLAKVIEDQLKKLAKEAPYTKVGIVTFGTRVTFVGDGMCKSYNIKSSIDNYDEILNEAKSVVSNSMLHPISKTLSLLLKKLKQ